MGRFISRDPIGYEGGINLYGYVKNNPVKYKDPPELVIVNIHNYPSVRRCLDILQKCKDYFKSPINRIGREIYYNSELKDPGLTDVGLFDQLKIYIGAKAFQMGITAYGSFDEMCATIAHELMHVYLYMNYGSTRYPEKNTAEDYCETYGTDVYFNECIRIKLKYYGKQGYKKIFLD